MSLWVMTVPVLSTGHLAQSTCDALMDPARADADFGLMTFPIDDIGFLLYVGALDDRPNERVDLGEREEGLPAELVKAVEWAHAEGYRDWIRFDAAGETIDGLPVHDW